MLNPASIGLAASIGFAVWELRHPAPLLDIRLFAKRSLTSGSVTLLVWFGVQAGVFVVLFPFFQAVLGWSGLMATLGLLLALAIAGAVASPAFAAAPKLTVYSGDFDAVSRGAGQPGGPGFALYDTRIEFDLQPGERIEMPVRFIVDRDLPADVRHLTLAYTLFDITARKPPVAQATTP